MGRLALGLGLGGGGGNIDPYRKVIRAANLILSFTAPTVVDTGKLGIAPSQGDLTLSATTPNVTDSGAGNFVIDTLGNFVIDDSANSIVVS